MLVWARSDGNKQCIHPNKISTENKILINRMGQKDAKHCSLSAGARPANNRSGEHEREDMGNIF